MDLGVALLMGIGGSLHCLGMCGPIALSLPFQHSSTRRTVFQALSYNFGRVFGYGFLGILPGVLGHVFLISGFQSTLSILLGTLIILGVIGFYSRNLFATSRLLNYVDAQIQRLMRSFLRAGSQKRFFQIGLVNAFIPCGMVYIALAGSLVQDSVMESIAYMMAFGLGTIPLMLIPCISANLISLNTRRKLKKVVPVFMCILGILFIMRGLGIEIPVELI